MAVVFHSGSNCWATCWNTEEGVCSSIQLMKMDLNLPENWIKNKKKKWDWTILLLFQLQCILTVLLAKMWVTHAVLPVPGLPDMYMLPDVPLSIWFWRNVSITSSSLSLQKILPGVDVWRAWRAFVKLLVTVKSPVKKISLHLFMSLNFGLDFYHWDSVISFLLEYASSLSSMIDLTLQWLKSINIKG